MWLWSNSFNEGLTPYAWYKRSELTVQSGRGTQNAKKPSQWFSRVLWERPKWELRNEPPLDRSGLTPEIPFTASLWIRSGYDMKVEMSAETYQVGSHFKALIKAILVAPLKSFERFFCISSSPAGLCTPSGDKVYRVLLGRKKPNKYLWPCVLWPEESKFLSQQGRPW